MALEDSGTWTIKDLLLGKKEISCKWVFRLKFNADGMLEQYKARLAVLENNLAEEVDFTEIFASVAKIVTVRSFLQQAVSHDWEVHQMDVHSAFLRGDLEEEIYMHFSPGFQKNDKNKVCRLHKSFYGLKQPPRGWFAKLGTTLKDYSFI